MMAALWRACNAAARACLAAVPRSSAQQLAIRRLRADIEQLPVLPRDAASSTFWVAQRARLRQLILSSDPRAFLTWAMITETMFPAPYARFARIELRALRKSDRWNVWRRVIREQIAGLPFPCLFYPLSSTNAIHHAYHLYRFETQTGMRIQDFGTIAEFGGGYGSLCRVAHRRGFTGQYVLFDLPEQSALQRYYLSSVGISGISAISTAEAFKAAIRSETAIPRLFVATWSLSEAPLSFRKEIADAITGFDAFLLAYQHQFEEVNNSAFFAEWQSWFPSVRWTVSNISHLPRNSYLFGVTAGARSQAG